MDSFFFQPVGASATTPRQDFASDPNVNMDASACYGVFHEPQGHFMADHAVLFLYPWGQEYVRSHRAIRKIALYLETKGVPSLRFDYRGTGDSGGQDTALNLETAVTDAQSALRLLQTLSGTQSVRVCAIRFGALVAFKAFSQERSVKELVCWDPVLVGQQYTAELLSPQTTSRIQHKDDWWINGYPLSSNLQNTLNAANVLADDWQTDVTIYGSEQTPTFVQWIQQRQQHGQSIKTEHCFAAGERLEWGSINTVGGFINPAAIVQSLEQRLAIGDL